MCTRPLSTGAAAGGTLRALLPVRMSFSCSGRMTCQSSGARPCVMSARTILRSARRHAQAPQRLRGQADSWQA